MAITVLTATTQAAAVNYRFSTSGTTDWSGITNNTFFYDLVTRLPYFKDSGGNVQDIFFTGGTVVGATRFTNGLTGNTGLFSGSAQNILTVVGSGSTQPLFTVQGSSGELFSITDSLTGSLFSINNISGLPILEVFSDDTILMGNYLAPSLNTTARITANSGTTNIYSIPTSAYTGAFYDYTVADGSNARAGNIMAIFSGSSVQFTESSTLDIGNTNGITMSVIVSGGNATLRVSATTNNWTVKTIVRSI